MRIIYLTLVLVLTFTQIFAQSERPETIVIPVSSLGEVSDIRKQILQNSLEENLKDYFMLISQERFDRAQEAAFEELDYEECTEDQCIVLIQEMLQVENVFSLQVIVEGNNTQLSLSWRNLDEKKKATDVCKDCDSFELNNRISTLVKKLVDVSSIKQVSSLSVEEMKNIIKEEEELKQKEEEEKLIQNEEEWLAKIKEEEEEIIRKQEVARIKKEKEKENYFKKFYPNRKKVLKFNYSTSDLGFDSGKEKEIDNSTTPLKKLRHVGINIGFRYYIIEKISIDINLSQRSLSSLELKTPNIERTNQSGESTDINLVSSYHVYVNNWEWFIGGGLSVGSYSGKYEVSSTKYETKVNLLLPNVGVGLNYHFDNNLSIVIEGIYFIHGQSEVTISNNKNKHYISSWGHSNLGIGYNF